jgi:hypothetical protein
MTKPNTNTKTIEAISVPFKKPPISLFGITIYCRHEWKEYWKTIGEGVQTSAFRCTRCEKDKP